ncbi:MAG: DNA repair protein RadA [Ignavibacteria bacterium]
MKSATKSKFVCQNCGYTSPKWLGKCPECFSWNSFVEELIEVSKKKNTKHSLIKSQSANIKLLHEVANQTETRIKTGIEELDRVLGGGIVTGSVLLIGGDPGIGKSTLMLQIANKLKDKKILYVSGEESASQIRLRAERINVIPENFYIVSETDLEIVTVLIEQYSPEIVVIDSIQTVYRPDLESSPGTVTQLRESTSLLTKIAKSQNISIFLVGHITKDGSLAGPKIIEHMVDVVLQFEGERTHYYRILRSIKNRFGSTNEIGIFEMTENGLREVPNPSEVFLSQRNYGASGCVISSAIEGTRPVLIEVQALVSSSNYAVPQRTAIGFDYKRLNIIIAVLEKRAGLFLNKQDIFINVAGGIKIEEPAIDLAVAMSLYSSFCDIPIDSQTVVIGEVGLAGEIRTIHNIEKRINEAAKLGFKTIVVPKNNLKNLNLKKYNIKPFGVQKINEVIEFLF